MEKLKQNRNLKLELEKLKLKFTLDSLSTDRFFKVW